MSTKTIKWRCPSNIALVKYWGKKEGQIPCNPSVSFSLAKSYTDTKLILSPKKKKDIDIQYFFEGAPNKIFSRRIRSFLEKNAGYFPILYEKAIEIHSGNSFPHSAGIASSASFFGSLVLTLLTASGYTEPDFVRKASFLARLGSGSACRSMFGGYTLWGAMDEVPGSSDEYAVPVTNVHSQFLDLHDTIAIVDDGQKAISSSKGHDLMKDHRFAESRFRQANDHCKRLLQILQSGNFKQFSTIIEQEALALHAMMMTSEEYYMLMKPGTVDVINRVQRFREETGYPVCFTLDAGPNVHLIYSKEGGEINTFLEEEIKPLVKRMIYDEMGTGPQHLTLD